MHRSQTSYKSKYSGPVARAFASPELAADLAQYGVTDKAVREWIVRFEPEYKGFPATQNKLYKGVKAVLKNSPEYHSTHKLTSSTYEADLWRLVPVDGQSLQR